MATDDIYKSKGRYERWIKIYIGKERILQKPNKSLSKEQNKKDKFRESQRRYYCKNKINLQYYKKLIRKFEVNDQSYKRRMVLLNTLNILTHYIDVNLNEINGLEKEDIIINIRKTTKPSNLKRTEFEIKRIGNLLFEESESS